MEIISVAQKIENKIADLERDSKHLQTRARARAKTSAIYDRELAKTLMALKNGKQFKLDNQTIESPPATITEKIAKGIVWREKFAMDKADLLYKNNVEWLRNLQAILNGLQSINRYLQDK